MGPSPTTRAAMWESRRRSSTTPSRTAAGPAVTKAAVIQLLDHGGENIPNDSADDGGAAKVVRNKPAGLVDACYTVTGQRITDQTVCQQLYPLHANPRLAAGEPLAQDVLKCALKNVNPR